MITGMQDLDNGVKTHLPRILYPVCTCQRDLILLDFTKLGDLKMCLVSELNFKVVVLVRSL